MQSLSERTAGFTDSVIRRMTRVSMQYDAVNLSQGFPDFEPPKELLDRLAQVAYEDYLGFAELPRGAGRQADLFHGPKDRPEHRDRCDLRQHGGDDGCDDDSHQSG